MTLTVPAILAITIFIAYMSDQTINRITLFAFLLSLGLLVDDVIVVIENIHRHLRTLKTLMKKRWTTAHPATDEDWCSDQLSNHCDYFNDGSYSVCGADDGRIYEAHPS